MLLLTAAATVEVIAAVVVDIVRLQLFGCAVVLDAAAAVELLLQVVAAVAVSTETAQIAATAVAAAMVTARAVIT